MIMGEAEHDMDRGEGRVNDVRTELKGEELLCRGRREEGVRCRW